jgi:hypothetical protein
VFRGDVAATIDGFRRAWDVEVKDTDTWTYDFTLDETTPRATFHLVMDKTTGNLFTDCAVNILDGDGVAVAQTGFNGLDVDIATRLPEGKSSASYTLQVVGAFALAPDMKDWGFKVEEQALFGRPVQGEAKRKGGGELKLYSGLPTDVAISFDGQWPTAPGGMGYAGKVQFLDHDLADKAPGDEQGRVVLEVPITIGD